jgi:hypothetical protein
MKIDESLRAVLDGMNESAYFLDVEGVTRTHHDHIRACNDHGAVFRFSLKDV